jgi:hypothetical protein
LLLRSVDYRQFATVYTRAQPLAVFFDHFIESPKTAVMPDVEAAQSMTGNLAGWAIVRISALIRPPAVPANTAQLDRHRIGYGAAHS